MNKFFLKENFSRQRSPDAFLKIKKPKTLNLEDINKSNDNIEVIVEKLERRRSPLADKEKTLEEMKVKKFFIIKKNQNRSLSPLSPGTAKWPADANDLISDGNTRAMRHGKRESILLKEQKNKKVNFSPESKNLDESNTDRTNNKSDLELSKIDSVGDGDIKLEGDKSKVIDKLEEKKENDHHKHLTVEKKTPRNNIVLIQNATKLLTKGKKNTYISSPKEKQSEFYLDVIGILDKEENQNQILPGKRNISEFDIWDERFSPKEMVQICIQTEGPHGKSPIFKGGRYEWLPVFVEGYNEVTKKYKVRLEGTENAKNVGRLALLFNEDDPMDFKLRIEHSKKLREIADQEMRFLLFIENMTNAYRDKGLPDEFRERILKKTFEKQRKIESMYTETSALVEGLLKEVDHQWISWHKRHKVLDEMEDPENHQIYRKSKIPIKTHTWKQKKPDNTASLSLLDKRAKISVIQNISKSIFTYKRSYKESIMLLYTRKAFLIKRTPMFEMNIKLLRLPTDIHTFEKDQLRFHQSSKYILLSQWREYIVQEIQDLIQAEVRIFETNKANYFGTEHEKMLHHIDMRFSEQIRSGIFERTLEEWFNFIKKFTYPENEEQTPWIKLKIQLFNINLKISMNLTGPSQSDKSPRRVPVENSVEEPSIIFDPTEEEVKEILIEKPLNNLIDTINNLALLEKSVFPLLELPARSAYHIENNNEKIESIRKRLQETISKCFAELNPFLEKYRQYSYLIGATESKIWKDFIGIKKRDQLNSIENLNVKKIEEGLEKLLEAKREIGNLSPNEIKTQLFVLKAKECKDYLLERASYFYDMILRKTYELFQQKSDELHKKYEEINVKLTTTPTKEEKLMELKDILVKYPTVLLDMQKELSHLEKVLKALEFFFFKIETEKVESFYFLRTWPKEIRASGKKGQDIANVQEKKFLAALDAEKEQFMKDLIQIGEKFDSIKKISTYRNAKEQTAEVHGLNERLDRASEKSREFNVRDKLFNRQPSEYDDLKALLNEFEPYYKLWNFVLNFEMDKTEWLNGSFIKLVYSSIEKKIEGYLRDTLKIQKIFMDSQEENAFKITTVLKEDIEKFKENLWIVEYLTQEAFQKKPIYWREVFRDCELIFIEPSLDMSFAQLIEHGLINHRERVEDVAMRAEKQWGIEKKLTEIQEKGKEIRLEVMPYRKTGTFILRGVDKIMQLADENLNTIMIMKASPYVKPSLKKALELEMRLSHIQETLDVWIKLQRMWLYLEPIFTSEDFKRKMVTEKSKFDLVDKHWRSTMNNLYKEPYIWDVIDSERMKFDLDQSLKSLESIQRNLSDYLQVKRKYFPRFFFLSDDELLELLAQTKEPRSVQKHINKCFEAVHNLIFDDYDVIGLVSIEGEKIDLVKKVNVVEGDKRGNVERWLSEIESSMKLTVKCLLEDTLKAEKMKERSKWILEWPGQMILACKMIKWTNDSEQAILKYKDEPNSIKNHINVLQTELDDIVNLVRGNLTPLHRLTLEALIVITVHTRDVSLEVCKLNLKEINSFIWLSQMRYYWEESMVKAKANFSFRDIALEGLSTITPGTEVPIPIPNFTSPRINPINPKTKIEGKLGQINTRPKQNTIIANSGSVKNIPVTMASPPGKLDEKSDAKLTFSKATVNILAMQESQMVKHTDLKIKMIYTVKSYGYEYAGNTTRLVITPLNERCFRTLMAAYQFAYGGAPEGPAGTGKTESVKDLAKSLGIPCVVFNCSDTLNYKTMSKLFKGIATSGSWICLDEFNRIDLEVLSVVAQQIMSIHIALKDKSMVFNIDDEELPLVPSCCINITMNPGYAGRSELPENLKSLFRPCAMMVPDYRMISEIYLFSVGFHNARELAIKVVASLKLSSEQLSTQDHYDFGMRALKSILTAVGNLKRKSSLKDDLEEKVILQALVDVNLPKFNSQDIPIFLNITSDLFPQVTLPDINRGELNDQIFQKICQEIGIIPVRGFINKCYQLFDTLKVRHGLMLIGQTMSGKTKVLECLQKAITYLNGQGDFTQVIVFRLNPKAITSAQLYGIFDPDTKTWIDGVLPSIMRKCAKEGSDDDLTIYDEENNEENQEFNEDLIVQENSAKKWMVMDGPVDAVWVENLNTVLDDNKKLCLSTGEIIRMTANMTMIFEVEDLQHASPATISRCGMIFLEPNIVGWDALLRGYSSTQLPSSLTKFSTWIYDYLRQISDIGLGFLKKYGKFPVVTPSDMMLVNSLVSIFDCFLSDFRDTEKKNIGMETSAAEEIMRNYLYFSMIWGFGCALEETSRGKYNIFLIDLFNGREIVEKHSIPLIFPDSYKSKQFISLKLAEEKNLFEIGFDKLKSRWVRWSDYLEHYTFNDLLIPTVDNTRNSYLITMLIQNKKHFLINGQTGTGKTVNILRELNQKFMNEHYTNFQTSFSGQTTEVQIQRLIETKINTKRRRGYYYPEEGKNEIILFIDDVNMPVKNKFGAQPPIELLRQLLDSKGWYDLDNREFKFMCGAVVISAMTVTPGLQNAVTLRFLRHFFMFYVETFEEDSLLRIFSNVLEWLFQRMPFKFEMDILSMRETIVKASIELFNSIRSSKNLLPTPAKSHYIFNLRDMGKIFLSISKVSAKLTRTRDDFIKFWLHECLRVYQDRMVNEEDNLFFLELLNTISFKYFGKNYASLVVNEPLLFSPLPSNPINPFAAANQDENYREEFHYAEVKEIRILIMNIEDNLNKFNSNHAISNMDLVLFTNAIQHICRITRILLSPLGHALLVGMGGSGRKSLSHLSAFIVQYDLFTIEGKSWVEDIKKVLRNAGLSQKPTVMLVSDSNLDEEGNSSHLEDLCQLLKNGEIANFFKNEDKARMGEELGTSVANMSLQNKYLAFVKNCQEYLHIILCMSPVGDIFKKKLRVFPALVTCTTVDWFLPWAEDALRTTAERMLKQLQGDFPQKDKMIKVFIDMHERSIAMTDQYLNELRRFNYVTPTMYIGLLNTFKDMYKSRKKKLEDLINRYEQGLEKLKESEEDVLRMHNILEDLRPKLQKSTEDNKKMLDNLKVKQAEADQKRALCEEEEQEMIIQRAEAKRLQDECKQDLDRVLPLLSDAITVLEKITRDDLTKVKSYANPPKAVDLVMQAVCIIFGEDDNVRWKQKDGMSLEKVQDFWEYSKKFLLNDKLIKRIQNFKEDSIRKIHSTKVIKLNELIREPDFEKTKIFNASTAAGNLSIWVRAVAETNEAMLIVDPKRALLEIAQQKLKKTETLLKEKKRVLLAVIDLIAELEKEYEKAKIEKEELETQVTSCQSQLYRAEQLITELAVEKELWRKRATERRGEGKNMIGDLLISSGYVTYLGPFPITYRNHFLKKWGSLLVEFDIPYTTDYSLAKILSDPLIVGHWVNSCKLPNDNFSIENAVILKNSKKWPLMIDPQSQAKNWVKEMEKIRKLIVMKPTQSQVELTFNLENAIQFGVPLLIEDVGEKLDPLVETVLLKNLIRQGTVYKLQLGDREIDFSLEFQLYLTTNRSNPHFSPETCVKVTLLNFLVTFEGLEDQMLNIVVKKEEPEKDQMRLKNITEFFRNQKMLIETEDTILKLITDSKKEILEDERLIHTLKRSKIESLEIEDKLRKQDIDRITFNQVRDIYKDVAKRTANLFFVLTDLAMIEPVYQFSLEWYVHLFEAAINESAQDKEGRINHIKDKFTIMLYESVCRSLLEKDKLSLPFLICIKILMFEKGLINNLEIRTLMLGGISTKADSPKPGWLTEKQWANIVEVSQNLKCFKKMDLDFTKNSNAWENIFESPTPYLVSKDKWPGGWSEKLNNFQRLIIIRLIRPDKLIAAIRHFVVEELDKRFIEPVTFNLQQALNDSQPRIPLIFILSQGVDPVEELIHFAEKLRFRNNLKLLSLGQGTTDKAESLIKKAVIDGKWVLLQNCHLAASWMPTLERIVENYPKECSKEYRLWLTTNPSPLFPVSILHKGIKMTFQPASGIKNSLDRIYSGLDSNALDETHHPGVWRKLLFGLSFFHSIVLERRKYGPLGWNIPYEFSVADFNISYAQLKTFLNDNEFVPWDALNYMVSETNYGGRVTEPNDRKLIKLILKQYFNEKLFSTDGYRFSMSGLYYCPIDASLDDVKLYIKSLPEVDNPEVFGLHENAEITTAIYSSNALCMTLLTLLPRTNTVEGVSSEKFVQDKATTFLKALPELFNIEAAMYKYPGKREESMNTVFHQELMRYNKLLAVIKESLQQIIKTVDGLITINNEVEDSINRIYDNVVPSTWIKVSYPSLKPLGSWMIDFINRLKFMIKWFNDGIPNTFWISGFFFTHSFLTGTLQNFARKNNFSIDSLDFDFQVSLQLDDKSPTPEDGSYIYGLFLDGARWNRLGNYLDHPEPKKLYDVMPYIWLIPMQGQGTLVKTIKDKFEHYNCPVYKTSKRSGELSTTGHSSNYLMNIRVPVKRGSSEDQWSLSGVALLTQLDD